MSTDFDWERFAGDRGHPGMKAHWQEDKIVCWESVIRERHLTRGWSAIRVDRSKPLQPPKAIELLTYRG